jgi:2-polyprenyl-3-methyl-5-hydroxy-6-metoxy-1,4-benzoquinol methylase
MVADNENLAKNREIYAELGRFFKLNPAVHQNAHFLNWGYEPVEGVSDWLPLDCTPPAGINRQHRRLVLELIGDVPVDGRSILDIGCGRGGGAENRHRAS